MLCVNPPPGRVPRSPIVIFGSLPRSGSAPLKRNHTTVAVTVVATVRHGGTPLCWARHPRDHTSTALAAMKMNIQKPACWGPTWVRRATTLRSHTVSTTTAGRKIARRRRAGGESSVWLFTQATVLHLNAAVNTISFLHRSSLASRLVESGRRGGCGCDDARAAARGGACASAGAAAHIHERSLRAAARARIPEVQLRFPRAVGRVQRHAVQRARLHARERVRARREPDDRAGDGCWSRPDRRRARVGGRPGARVRARHRAISN